MTLRLSRDGRVLVIAEVGINHDGLRGRALRLIDEAARAGAGAVKFQLFRASHMYVRNAGRYRGSDGRSHDIYRLMEQTAMPRSWLRPLVRRARDAGLAFICTACDEDSALSVADAGSDAIKIASSELTHVPLLAAAASTGLPVIISTGAATMEETGEAIAVLRSSHARRIAVLHCVAAYPADLAECNLRVITTLRSLYPDLVVGFSDHTLDAIAAPVLAARLGATVIEKHVTLDRRASGADHAFSLEPGDLARLVAAVRQPQRSTRTLPRSALGSPVKRVGSAERYVRGFARRWLFTVRRVRAGSKVTARDVRVLRPGQNPARGLAPRFYASVIGRTRFARDLPPWSAVRWADLEPVDVT